MSSREPEHGYRDSRWWPISFRSAGMRTPPDPPVEADPFVVVSHYVAWYEKEFARLRVISRTRVDRVITLIAALNAVIAVLGVASAAWRYPWFGPPSQGPSHSAPFTAVQERPQAVSVPAVSRP